jgi:YidC/Oxa1 family membrane protein insertase
MLFGLNLLARSADILKDPGVITGPIAWVLGEVLNFFFNIVHNFTETNSLGISIILLTIFARCLIIPIAYRQQKSMFVMQKLQPELKKIQDKYKDRMSDPDIQKKVQMETQKLYSEHNYSPLSGCLPLLIQMPIFFGLYYVMRHPFLYIDFLTNVYNDFSTQVLAFAAKSGADSKIMSLINEFGTGAGLTPGLDITVEIFSKLMNALNPSQIKQLADAVGTADVQSLVVQKETIETFMGISLTETVGFALNKKLIVPILSAATTWFSSWMMTRKNVTTDPQMKSQQRTMNIIMPIMMAWITTGLPGGVGLYWVVSNIFQICQQAIISRHFEHKRQQEEENNKGDKK